MKIPLLFCSWMISAISFAENAPLSSLAVDGGIWATIFAIESTWYLPAGQHGFFSSGLDSRFRNATHDSDDTPHYNQKERDWRKFSDVGITGLVATSIAHPLFGPSKLRSQTLVVSRAFAINNLVTTSLKYSVHRSRPKPARYSSLSQSGDDAKSFPSGHASNAFVAATSFALLNPDSPLLIRAIGYSLASAVGIARVMGDRHNFTDVAVGAAIGYGVTYATVATLQTQVLQISVGPTSAMIKYDF